MGFEHSLTTSTAAVARLLRRPQVLLALAIVFIFLISAYQFAHAVDHATVDRRATGVPATRERTVQAQMRNQDLGSRTACAVRPAPDAWQSAGIPIHDCTTRLVPGEAGLFTGHDGAARNVLLGPLILTLTGDEARTTSAHHLASLLGLNSSQFVVVPSMDVERDEIRDIHRSHSGRTVAPGQVAAIATHVTAWARAALFPDPVAVASQGKSPFYHKGGSPASAQPRVALDPFVTARTMTSGSMLDAADPENAWILVFEDDALPHPFALFLAQAASEGLNASHSLPSICRQFAAKPFLTAAATRDPSGRFTVRAAEGGGPRVLEQVGEVLAGVHPAVEFVSLGGCGHGFRTSTRARSLKNATVIASMNQRWTETPPRSFLGYGATACTHAYAMRVRLARFLVGLGHSLAEVESRSPLGPWIAPLDSLLVAFLQTYDQGLGGVVAFNDWKACHGRGYFRPDTHGLFVQRSRERLPTTADRSASWDATHEDPTKQQKR